MDDHLYHQEAFQVWGGYSVAQEEEEALWHSTGDTWPTSIAEVIRRGWINCYLSDTNECVWLHLLTYQIERYLPLGGDDLSANCGCEWGDEGDGYWLRPPQIAARSWIVVRCSVALSDDFADCKDSKSDELINKGVPSEKYESVKESSEEKKSSRGLVEEKGGRKALDQRAEEKEGQTSIGRGEVWYYYNRVSGHSSWEEPTGWREIVSLAGGWILCAEEENLLEEMYWWNESTGDVMWYGEEYEDS